MKRILFVCHGNICRSPMAEFVMKHLLEEQHISSVEIASAAVSTEELGNDIYPPAKRKLHEKGITFSAHAARQMSMSDYSYYDYIICMDISNLQLMKYIIGNDVDEKVSLLMQWTGEKRDVADPWYTGDFETTYQDIVKGCRAIINQLI